MTDEFEMKKIRHQTAPTFDSFFQKKLAANRRRHGK